MRRHEYRDALDRSTLTLVQRAVARHLAERAASRKAGPTAGVLRECYPSVGDIVTCSGAGERAVRKAIGDLELLGWLTTRRVVGHRSHYTLRTPCVWWEHRHVAMLDPCMRCSTPCMRCRGVLHEVQGTPARGAPKEDREEDREEDKEQTTPEDSMNSNDNPTPSREEEQHPGRADSPALPLPVKPAATPALQKTDAALEEIGMDDWSKAMRAWCIAAKTTGKTLRGHARSSAEGRGLSARIKEHGLADVLRVIEWAWMSSHDTATFCRKQGHGLQTFMRPANFGRYLVFAAQEPPKAAAVVSYVPGQREAVSASQAATRAATRARLHALRAAKA